MMNVELDSLLLFLNDVIHLLIRYDGSDQK